MAKPQYFNDSNFDIQSEDLCKELIRLQDYKGIVKSQNKSLVSYTVEEEMKIPNLSLEELDKSTVESCIKNLQESFQFNMFIPEICQTRICEDEISKKFVTIGFTYHLPKIFFLPFEVAKEAYYNEHMFREFGRRIALGERDYLVQQILNNQEIAKSEVDLSPDSILEAVEKIRSKGMTPNVIFVPIKDELEMMKWSGKTYVKYDYSDKRSLTNASLVSDKYELKIVPPLGDVPKKDIILMSNSAVTWSVRIFPNNSALYVAFGNSRLYPLRFVDLMVGTKANCEIKPAGISILKINRI